MMKKINDNVDNEKLFLEERKQVLREASAWANIVVGL